VGFGAALLYWRRDEHLSAKLSLTEVLLCGWVIAAQLWYVLQFRPLLTFLAARFLHKP